MLERKKMLADTNAQTSPCSRLIIGITGASGMIYVLHLLQQLVKFGPEIHLLISEQAKVVLKEELNIDLDHFLQMPVIYHDCQNLASPLASGSFHTQGMIIAPCSMHSLGAIAQGLSFNLIHRAAAVCLKERRKLVLVPRESPLSSIHIKNMLTLSENGAVILPAMPAFYNRPQNIEELVEYFIQRILDQLNFASSYFEKYAKDKMSCQKKTNRL